MRRGNSRGPKSSEGPRSQAPRSGSSGAGSRSGSASGGSRQGFGTGGARGGPRPNFTTDSAARRGPPGGGRSEEMDPALKKTRIVIGTHALAEAVKVRPEAILRVWVQQKWRDSSDLRDWMETLKREKISVEEKPESALERFGGHQGAVAFMKSQPQWDWEVLERKKKSQIILLDGIEDPHNLGAVLRSSWLMGVDGILLPQDRAVGLTPSAHKVACGGVEHVPVETVSSFASTVEKLKKLDYWVFGLSHKSTKSLFDLKMPDKIVWCVGAEDKGLRITTERLCDELVHIPQTDARASFNASVAAAIAINEGRRGGR